MICLYESLPTTIEYEGKEYKIKPSFDRVLEALDVSQDQTFFDEEKADYLLSLFVCGKTNVQDKWKLIETVYQAIITVPKHASDEKLFDFTQDAQYIYAGFMQAYGIDLFDQQDKLHWWKFNALFQGLPRDTQIMQIIDIRQRKLPNPTKHNREEIRQLARLKEIYRLEISQEERDAKFAKSLWSVAHKLENMVEK